MTTLEDVKQHNAYVRQHFSPQEILEMTCTKEDVANISASLLEYGRKQGHVWLIRTGPIQLVTLIPGGPNIPLHVEGSLQAKDVNLRSVAIEKP